MTDRPNANEFGLLRSNFASLFLKICLDDDLPWLRFFG